VKTLDEHRRLPHTPTVAMRTVPPDTSSVVEPEPIEPPLNVGEASRDVTCDGVHRSTSLNIIPR
jgi:hypothetical protein